MSIVKAINSYVLNVPVNTSNVRGVVHLACADGWSVVVQCQEATTLPNNQLNMAAKNLLAFAPAASYSRIVDMVRHEKPLRVAINEAVAPVTLNIVSGAEPVGEAE